MGTGDELDSVLAAADLDGNPWKQAEPAPVYRHSPELLARLMEIPVKDFATTQSGRVAKAVDAWIAHEFRRAGFDPDAVWPRASSPRVLPTEIRKLLNGLPSHAEEDLLKYILRLPAIAPKDARFLGRAYDKQVDVAMSDWSTGPEMLVSTKLMTASFGKNLSNRFEEAYGDAGNLRARYPLAAVGFLFLQHASIVDKEPATFERSVDMMRKLKDRGDGNGYTATCLILADWDIDDPSTGVTILPAADRGHSTLTPDGTVPADLGPEQFFEKLINGILEAAPVSYHVHAREKLAGRHLAQADD
ncbi:hypothetical protein ACFORJ_04655 [Corynebacterium hansenii]|uniref:Restriction endonuclease n=1 Tax=Corynebacterium hansenii TaxID=394964 RepID=A0ABV7ZLM0_9CORY|nr:hypothetical protein [Corynebacterium hansenii]WJY98714.1 hypothetical protein CHAN_00345 [Corynebacterium hansenii]